MSMPNADSFERVIVNDEYRRNESTELHRLVAWRACDIKSRSPNRHSLYQRCHRLAILWMDECQVFLRARGP
jgi:hypothetical protein